MTIDIAVLRERVRLALKSAEREIKDTDFGYLPFSEWDVVERHILAAVQASLPKPPARPADAEGAQCGHPKSCYVRKWPLLDAVTTDDPARDYPDDEYCLVCAENAKVNGQWLNMVAEVLGPIPCGGTSLEIVRRWIVERCAIPSPAVNQSVSAPPSIKFTVDEVLVGLEYASEGRSNSVKPDLMANYLNKFIAHKLAATPSVDGKVPIGTVISKWGKVVKYGPAYWLADDSNLTEAADAGMIEALYAGAAPVEPQAAPKETR